MTNGVRPGWYADPLRRFEQRWYNGTNWTADVSDGGSRFVDPMGVEPGAVSSAGGSEGATSSSAGDTGAGRNTTAGAAMVLGIVAVSISWLPFIVVLGVIAAVLPLVLGWIGIRRARTTGAGRNRAIVGLITGASAMVAAVVGVALSIAVFDVYDRYLSPSPNETTITECTLAGSRATAAGTIENLGDGAADFSIVVGFVRRGTDNTHRTARADVDDVAPGGSADFEVAVQVELDDVDCIVLDVTGPLPFGVELD